MDIVKIYIDTFNERKGQMMNNKELETRQLISTMAKLDKETIKRLLYMAQGAILLNQDSMQGK